MMGMERRASWWAVRALAALVAIILFVPIALPDPEPEPDLSFRMTLQDAFARHRQFGTEIVYTYGPWGLLQHPGSDARTEVVTFGALLAVPLLFAAGVFMVARDGGASPLPPPLVIVSAGAPRSGRGGGPRLVALPVPI